MRAGARSRQEYGHDGRLAVATRLEIGQIHPAAREANMHIFCLWILSVDYCQMWSDRPGSCIVMQLLDSGTSLARPLPSLRRNSQGCFARKAGTFCGGCDYRANAAIRYQSAASRPRKS